MTRLDATATVPAASASLDDPEAFLPAPARPAGPDRWVVEFAVGPFHHEALVELGPVWRTEGRVGRAIAWAAAAEDHDAVPYERLTPRVHGAIVLEDGAVALRVTYRPRGGALGRAIDLVLRPVARRSVRWFVDAVATRMRVPASAAQGETP